MSKRHFQKGLRRVNFFLAWLGIWAGLVIAVAVLLLLIGEHADWTAGGFGLVLALSGAAGLVLAGRFVYGGPRDAGEIRLEEDGFRLLRGGRQSVRVRWRDVREIAAAEDKELVASGRLIFRTDECEDAVVVFEADPGFEALAQTLAAQFPGIPPDWRAQGPAEEQPTVLYRREDTNCCRPGSAAR